MRSTVLFTFFAALTSAQTPPNYPPTIENPLVVAYNNGSLILTPNALVPINATCTQPTIFLPRTHHRKDEKFMILLLDLSLNISTPCTTSIPSNITSVAAPGLEHNRTTYLHWFQGNLTLTHHPKKSTHATLQPISNFTIAPYVPPTPNVNDIPHTYAFYLLRQPADFVLPAEDQKRNLEGLYSPDRIGFDINGIVRAAGGKHSLIAGMYFREKGPEGEQCGDYVACVA